MASYHFSAQIIGRSPLRGGSGGAPRNAVALAAYRSGTRLRDLASGRTADFSRRRGVVHAEILAPEGSAPWLKDRAALWNRVEAMERRRDAQLAREINLALPHELSARERLALVRAFVAEHFVSRGMVADLAVHEPVVEKGDNPRNHHAHVMLTLRQGTPEGLHPIKTREWNSDSLLLVWRRAWTFAQNAALERAGFRARVDDRTLAAQRDAARAAGDRVKAAVLSRQPEIHIGPRARQAEARGRRLRSTARERATSRPRGGRFVSARGAARRRVVDYVRIDRGTSRARHVALLAQRERWRIGKLADRYEMRHARLLRRLAAARRQADHQREMRAREMLRYFERMLAALLGPRQKASLRSRDILHLHRLFERGRLTGRQRAPAACGLEL